MYDRGKGSKSKWQRQVGKIEMDEDFDYYPRRGYLV